MNKVRLSICILFFLFTSDLYADGLLLSIGKSSTIDHNKVTKVAYVYEVNKPLVIILDNNFYLNWEVSYFEWENKYGKNFTGGAITPILGYTFPWLSNEFYLRFGIGVAYIDQIDRIPWGNRHLGDNWTFEDKIDIGLKLNTNHNISLSLTHYSNAGTNKNNDGVNIFSLNYTFNW